MATQNQQGSAQSRNSRGPLFPSSLVIAGQQRLIASLVEMKSIVMLTLGTC